MFDLIMKKRPDLFDGNEESAQSRGLIGTIVALSFGLLLMLAAIPIFLFQPAAWFPGLLLIGLGVYIPISWFSTPMGLEAKENALRVLYLFREESYGAGDIVAINLEHQRSRSGYFPYVLVKIKGQKGIKLSGFTLPAPLLYQMLKTWRRKALSRRSANFLQSKSYS